MRPTDKTLPTDIRVAIYDLDGTVCRQDTLKLYLWQALLPHPLQWWKFLVIGVLAVGWKFAGIVSNHDLKRRALALVCRGLRPEYARLRAQRLMGSVDWNTDVMCQMKQMRNQGKVIILATASPDVYVTEIAGFLGVDKVVCTQMSRDGQGYWTGELAGENCYGEEKARRLGVLLASWDLSWHQCLFVSDSHADMPSFLLAAEARAVNPTRRLSRLMKIHDIREF